jgi:DMSO reductase family type II enzyme heme b subunit
MGRSLTVADKAVQFEAGAPYKIAFAVWQGSNLERAGLKSYSGAWLECEVAE